MNKMATDWSRLDRIERAIESPTEGHAKFNDEHNRLLTAQVMLTDRMDKLAEAQKHTDNA